MVSWLTVKRDRATGYGRNSLEATAVSLSVLKGLDFVYSGD